MVSHYTAVLLRSLSQVNFEGGLYILHTNERCSTWVDLIALKMCVVHKIRKA